MSRRPKARPAASPRIRPATALDWPRAEALFRACDDLHAEIAPGYFRSGARAADEWARTLADPTATALVAETAGLVGLVVVRIYDTPESPTMVPRRRGHVETLVVADGRRRRGIGRRLMDEAAAWARCAGAVELVLTAWAGNPPAEAFYARLGYRPLSQVLSVSLRAVPGARPSRGAAAAGSARRGPRASR